MTASKHRGHNTAHSYFSRRNDEQMPFQSTCTSQSQLALMTVFTWLHRAYMEVLVMLSETAAALNSIATPECEDKLRWVKCGLLTESCKQSRTPRTSYSSLSTRSKSVMKISPDVIGQCCQLEDLNQYTFELTATSKLDSTWLETIQNLYRWPSTWKLACENSKSGRCQHQIGSSLKTAPFTSALAQAIGIRLC